MASLAATALWVVLLTCSQGLADRDRTIIRNDDVPLRLDLEIGRFGSGKLFFDDPVDLAVNEDDDLFILEAGNVRIQVMSEKARFRDSWLIDSSGAGDLDDLVALTLDYDGKQVYILDSKIAKIFTFDLKGVTGPVFGERGRRPGQMTEPLELTVDSFDNVYVVDRSRQRVLKFHSSGQFIEEWGQKGRKELRLEEPIDIAYSDELRGIVYVLDRGRKAIFKYDRDGDLKEIIPLIPNVLPEGDLVAIETDDNDNLFVLDAKQLKLIMLNRHEIHVFQLGDENVSLEDPKGLVISDDGYYYLSDERRNRLFRFVMD